MTLPHFLCEGHFLVWQIHFLGVLGHFLSHDSFRAKVGTQLQKYDIATFQYDLATPKYDLATLFVARSFLLCVRSFQSVASTFL